MVLKNELGVTVVVPDHSELDRGTLAGIIRQSLLPRTLFEAK
jgi:predicted RNA binding protein YcfA (HicA-like mRNA interferase family)